MIALIGDTHMPKGARRLPERCVELLASAEAILHAGDISTVGVLAEIEAIGPPVHAVLGNVDEPALGRLLPETREIELGGRTVALVHDAGPARGRLERLRGRFPAADVVVFGHSHIPLHEEDGGLQIFNPGSPTERRRSPQRSMGLLHLEGSAARLEHVWLGTA